jgi:hypothetical protein
MVEVKVTVASPEGVKVRFVSNLGATKWQEFPERPALHLITSVQSGGKEAPVGSGGGEDS